jgi:hypothetical protein
MYLDVDNDMEGKPKVSQDEVGERLHKIVGWVNWFSYTSYSHTAEKPKFRVIIQIDRYITRTEMLRIFHVLNHEVLGGQGDDSIYDPGDYLYAPPHETRTTQQSGGPLCVDDILAREERLRAEHPHLYGHYLDTTPKRIRTTRVRTAEERAALDAQMEDMSVGDAFEGIADRDIFNPIWADLYRDACKGHHYTTFRSIVAKVWMKSGGSLTRGEMMRIMEELDSAGQGYMRANYPDWHEKWCELLDNFLPKLPLPHQWEPLLEREESNLVIRYLEGECGAGKSHNKLTDMKDGRGRYVYVLDKNENIERRREEFFKIAGPRIGVQFATFECHSRTGNGEHRVARQLENTLHADWSGWDDHEIIYDEVPETFTLFEIDARSHADLLKSRVRILREDGNCYEVGLTTEGEAAAAQMLVDDYEAVHRGLLIMLRKPGNRVWVKKHSWDNAHAEKLSFFALLSPLNLRSFNSVYMLGDSLMSSTLARVWREKWNVQFEPVEFKRRVRRIPTSERATIHYFSESRDASFRRFREGDMPLTQLGWFLRDEAKKAPILWTSNERTKSALMDGCLDTKDWQPPKAHGRNDLQHYRRVAWLAAMKPSRFEIGAIREVCGMTADELIEWREFNAMYQFIMRCELRDYHASSPIDIYVFSDRQARYLERRIGGTLVHHPGIVMEKVDPRQYGDAPTTGAERMKALRIRLKMDEQKVTDARHLKIEPPLTEREIHLANASYARQRPLGE